MSRYPLPRAMANRWTIDCQPNGLVDVLKNGRSFVYDLEDVREAQRRIKKSRFYGTEDTVTLIAIDGHRSPLRIT